MKPISSQRISDLLDRIDAQAIEGFYRRWGKRFTGEDTVCIDSTSVSSYSQCNEYVKRGYNRDHEPLEQVNVLGVFSASQMLPMVMRMLPGTIADVSKLLKELKYFNQLGLKQPALLIDKGFDSAENITYLLDKRIKFIMMAKYSRKDRKTLFERHKASIRVPSNIFYFRMTGITAQQSYCLLAVRAIADGMLTSTIAPDSLKRNLTGSMQSCICAISSCLMELI